MAPKTPLDRTDWYTRVDPGDSRRIWYRCIRSASCWSQGWFLRDRAARHRLVHCQDLDSSYCPPYEPSARRLIPSVCDQLHASVVVRARDHVGSPVRPTNEQQAAVCSSACAAPTSDPERALAHARGTPVDDEQQMVQTAPGTAPFGASISAASSGGRGPSSSRSTDHPTQHSLPSMEIADEDAIRYAGPPVDNWETDSDAASTDSGTDCSQTQIQESDNSDTEDQSFGTPYDPQFDVLQKRLVEHMQKHLKPGGGTRPHASTGWAQAADKPVTTQRGAIRVRCYAYNHLRMYRDSVESRKCADRHLLNNAYGLTVHPADPDPAGVENCYPPSVAAAQAVLDVPELQQYEVHLCPKGCIHWWFFMSDYVRHFQNCTDAQCPSCVCPHCDSRRFVKDKRGIHGAERCWFFFDCLHVKALDAPWAAAFLRAHHARDDAQAGLGCKPAFHRWPECSRILDTLPAGMKRHQAVLGDIFADAAEFVGGQSVHVFMWRFKDAPPDLISKSENVVELLVNKGGRKEPKCLEACFTLILEWLIALGPDSDLDPDAKMLLVPKRSVVGLHHQALLDIEAMRDCDEDAQPSVSSDSTDPLHQTQVVATSNSDGQSEESPQAHSLSGTDSQSLTPERSSSGQASSPPQMQESSNSGQGSGAESSRHQQSGRTEAADITSEGDTIDHELIPVHLMPVLATLGADFMGRCKLTAWQAPSGNHHGGWCGCINRGLTRVGKVSHGYGAPIPQPWLLEKEYSIWEPMSGEERRQKLDDMANVTADGDMPRCFVGDDRLHLSSQELIDVGEFARQLAAGIRQFYDRKDKTLLDKLGVKGVSEAKEIAGRLGRKGRLPCTAARYLHQLPYINPESLVVLPPAHLFLRALVKRFFTHVVGNTTGWPTPSQASSSSPLLLCRAAIEAVKIDWQLIETPHGTPKPRDPTQYIGDLKMEELGGLLWAGGVLVKHGSPELIKAWGHLQPAVTHYIHAADATTLEMRLAAQHLKMYAAFIEKLVQEERVCSHLALLYWQQDEKRKENISMKCKVPESMLTPSLHVATCRSLRQELQRGPMALEAEWFMERFFLEPKNRVAGVGKLAAEVTWMKSCTMLDRALYLHEARYPDAGLHLTRKRKKPAGKHADPRTGSTELPCLVGVGPRCHYTSKVANRASKGSSKRRVPVSEVIAGCIEMLHVNESHQGLEWWQEAAFNVRKRIDDPDDKDSGESVFRYCKATVLHRCRFVNFLVSSGMSSYSLAREGRSHASSYCLVDVGDDESGVRVMPAFVRYFMLVQWEDHAKTVDRIARVNLIREHDRSEFAEQAFCSRVWRFDPATDMGKEQDRWLRVDKILRPVVLIKRRPGLSLSSLIQFHNFHLGGIEAPDDH